MFALILVDPDVCTRGTRCEGGVRPARMCPCSVRSRSPARARSSASAISAGFTRFPVPVTAAFLPPADLVFAFALAFAPRVGFCVAMNQRFRTVM